MRRAVEIELSDEERATLVMWSRGKRTQARVVERAKIALASADGKQNNQIAQAFCDRTFVLIVPVSYPATGSFAHLDDLGRVIQNLENAVISVLCRKILSNSGSMTLANQRCRRKCTT